MKFHLLKFSEFQASEAGGKPLEEIPVVGGKAAGELSRFEEEYAWGIISLDAFHRSRFNCIDRLF